MRTPPYLKSRPNSFCLSVYDIHIDYIPLTKRTMEYAIKMKNGEKFFPILVKKISDSKYRVVDGRHRFTATRLNGIKEIECVLY